MEYYDFFPASVEAAAGSDEGSRIDNGNDQDVRNMVGSYKRVDEPVKDERIVLSAKLAVDHLSEADQKYSFMETSTSVSPTTSFAFQIIRAYEQVVAGKNYRLIILLQDPVSKACVGSFGVTIYDHFGELSISSWNKELPCELALATINDDAQEVTVDGGN